MSPDVSRIATDMPKREAQMAITPMLQIPRSVSGCRYDIDALPQRRGAGPRRRKISQSSRRNPSLRLMRFSRVRPVHCPMRIHNPSIPLLHLKVRKFNRAAGAKKASTELNENLILAKSKNVGDRQIIRHMRGNFRQTPTRVLVRLWGAVDQRI